MSRWKFEHCQISSHHLRIEWRGCVCSVWTIHIHYLWCVSFAAIFRCDENIFSQLYDVRVHIYFIYLAKSSLYTYKYTSIYKICWISSFRMSSGSIFFFFLIETHFFHQSFPFILLFINLFALISYEKFSKRPITHKLLFEWIVILKSNESNIGIMHYESGTSWKEKVQQQLIFIFKISLAGFSCFSLVILKNKLCNTATYTCWVYCVIFVGQLFDVHSMAAFSFALSDHIRKIGQCETEAIIHTYNNYIHQFIHVRICSREYSHYFINTLWNELKYEVVQCWTMYDILHI